ncbi:MAG: hypothetical protein AB7O59_09090 [Pirellulales bacterium]
MIVRHIRKRVAQFLTMGVRSALVLVCTAALGTTRAAADDNRFPPPMPAEQAFDDLQSNTRVDWLVRLVAYDPADPVLRIDRLQALGAPHEDFTFVADYAELRGYTAEAAARLSGGAIHQGQHVSAIIFPLNGRRIYPASVRGLLQLVREVDRLHAAQPGYQAAGLDKLLDRATLADLDIVTRQSWAWNAYRARFGDYARAVAQLKQRPAGAIAHIGHIGRDWCEPGCSRLTGHHSPLRPDTMTLELADGSPLNIERFGIRVFLIRNLAIDGLDGRMLIDFDDPTRQIIPYFPLPTDGGAGGRTSGTHR